MNIHNENCDAPESTVLDEDQSLFITIGPSESNCELKSLLWNSEEVTQQPIALQNLMQNQ